MNKRYLMILLICYSATYGQNKDSINGNLTEKLEKILIDGTYKFNAYDALQKANKESNNHDFDPFTFELIDITGDKSNFRGDSREKDLLSSDIKKLDVMVLYKIIKKNSIIILTAENGNYPNFAINLISNQLELMDSGYILDFDKEIIVNDNNNILKSGWTGYRWQKDIYSKGLTYGYSVTIGRIYDSNKIYFNIKTFNTTKKVNLFLISLY